MTSASYIINRLPTHLRKFKTLYEILLHRPPDYTHLKSFGCLAFASNPSKIKDKPHPRGTPCVFIGYPPSQKGYKMLDIATSKAFVSTDVVFVEHIFPLHYKNHQVYRKPLPLSMPSISYQLSFDMDYIVPETDTTPPNSPSPPHDYHSQSHY